MDNKKCREDLKEAKVMQRFWPWDDGTLLETYWILSKQDKDVVKKTLYTICTPIGTMHSLKDAIASTKEKESSGFKTHYLHKMLQVLIITFAFL